MADEMDTHFQTVGGGGAHSPVDLVVVHSLHTDVTVQVPSHAAVSQKGRIPWSLWGNVIWGHTSTAARLRRVGWGLMRLVMRM